VIRIGLLGCGNIGGTIADRRTGVCEIVACHDRLENARNDLASRTGAASCDHIADLLAADFPVLVEAASVEAARDVLPPALTSGKDVVVLSVGALADTAFRERVRQLARDAGRRVRIPSGAVFGLDNIKVARVSALSGLLLRTTKPPRSLGLPADSTRSRVFHGPASEAIRRFPRNINVSISLAVAAAQEPEVEIWADPEVTSNRHEILAEGDFGRVSIATDNVPSPANPATSYLAALSVLTLLKDLDDPLVVGT
jgi:aspartate dehydrogenase